MIILGLTLFVWSVSLNIHYKRRINDRRTYTVDLMGHTFRG